MPINQLPEWYIQKAKYENATDIPTKIRELEKLISMTRKHKGVEKQMLQFNTKLAKLRDELVRQKKVKKGARKSTAIPKQGFQIVIIGFTKSGKSTFLKKLTNADPEISEFPFTTKTPEVGMLDYEGAQVQMVEIPALDGKNLSESMNLVRNADGIIILYRNENELKQIEELLDKYSTTKPAMKFEFGKYPEKKEIFDFFHLIRVYTKEPGKKAETNKPMIMAEGSTILDTAKELHKDFYKNLKYARVWGSSKFPGQRVEKEYKLKDGDVIEYHI